VVYRERFSGIEGHYGARKILGQSLWRLWVSLCKRMTACEPNRLTRMPMSTMNLVSCLVCIYRPFGEKLHLNLSLSESHARWIEQEIEGSAQVSTPQRGSYPFN
jgi:hypothetical protein